MPLTKSGSDAAFKSNVAAERNSGKPRDQALAIAYRVQRENRASGGPVGMAAGGLPAPPFAARGAARDLSRTPKVGGLHSPIPGRTDHIPLNVPSGAYVLPADHVSSLGQGNTSAGMKILDHMFSAGPYGVKAKTIGKGSRMGRPQPMRAPKRFADGGIAMPIDAPQPEPEIAEPVPIAAAGGEYVIAPDLVTQIGGGDMQRGHEILDAWVLSQRKDHIKTLRKLPGPARD